MDNDPPDDDALRGAILTALETVRDPETGRSPIDDELVTGLVVKDGQVGFALDVGTPERARGKEPLRQACEERIAALPGVRAVHVVLTAERQAEPQPPAPKPAPKAAPHADPRRGGVPGVSKVIAVASGKGGVGKSTLAVNLALALRALDLKVGLMDADIYGPSLPRLLALTERPRSEDKRLIPLEAQGLKAMSMGLLVDESKAVIWRGPMVTTAITQMLYDVAWAPLDVLVVDMPPGTGDAQLTLAQKVPLAGAVIVSTPQDLALVDARKGIAMFEKVHVPILGLVENMSYFHCPACGTRSDIFGHGGARETAEALSVPFLGEVPLHMAIRESSDGGRPVVAADPEGPQARAFMAIAERLSATLSSAR